MDITKLSETILTRLNSPRLTAVAEKLAQRIPLIRDEVEATYQEIIDDLEEDLKPYRDDFPRFGPVPETAVPQDEILARMRA